MSNRYRTAFRETICGAPRNSRNDFHREQSSFRETMIGSTYEGTQLIRVKSLGRNRFHSVYNPYTTTTKHHNASAAANHSIANDYKEQQDDMINEEAAANAIEQEVENVHTDTTSKLNGRSYNSETEFLQDVECEQYNHVKPHIKFMESCI